MQGESETKKAGGVAKMIENLTEFKAQIVNDQNRIKSRKKDVQNSKRLTAAELIAMKDKIVKKNNSMKEKQDAFKKKLEGKKQVTKNADKPKAKMDKKPQTAPGKMNKTSPKDENLKKDVNTTKIKPDKEDKNTKPVTEKAKFVDKPIKVIKSEKLRKTPFTKKDKEKLKQEMKTKIENLPTAPFKAKKLDEETVASVRKALSVLVDKALDTLQNIPRDKLRAASMNLERNYVKSKPIPKLPPYGDSTAQLQANLKKSIIKEFEKVGHDIVSRSKNV